MYWTKQSSVESSTIYLLHHEDTPSPLQHLKLYEHANPNSMAHSFHLQEDSMLCSTIYILYALVESTF